MTPSRPMASEGIGSRPSTTMAGIRVRMSIGGSSGPPLRRRSVGQLHAYCLDGTGRGISDSVVTTDIALLLLEAGRPEQAGYRCASVQPLGQIPKLHLKRKNTYSPAS